MPTKGYPEMKDKNVNNYLGISVHPRKLSYTNPVTTRNMRANIVVKEDSSLEKFMFLAPEQLQDSISHEGEPIENIMSKSASMIGAARQAASMGTKVHKVDTPLIYSDSNRRKLELMIYLGVREDPYRDVVEPVRLLEAYSSPSLYGDNRFETEVTVPNVFKVDTKVGNMTVNLINIRHAVLTAVQPTWKGPYISGYPTSCELTLSFEDMQPLSKSSFGRVTVTSGSGENIVASAGVQ